MFVVKSELIPMKAEDYLLHFTDGEETACVRLPSPAASVEVIQATGELVGDMEDDLDTGSTLTGRPDEDFLFG